MKSRVALLRLEVVIKKGKKKALAIR